MGVIVEKINGEIAVKTSKKHPTDDQLIREMADVIMHAKKIVKRDNWKSMSYIKTMGYSSVNTYCRHFGTFDDGILKALKYIKEHYPKAYYQERKI